MAESLQSLELTSKLVNRTLEDLTKFRRESELAHVRWLAISEKIQTFRRGLLGVVTDIVGVGPVLDRYHHGIQQWVKRAKTDQEEMRRLVDHLNRIDPQPWQRWSVAIAAALWSLRGPINDLNKGLAQSNNYLSTRLDLLTASTAAMVKTGASTDQAVRAIRSLVFYGLETDKTYSRILENSLQLEKTYGLAVEHSTELFFVYRKLNVESSTMADNIAKIVDQTALAADEAARYATELGRAAIFLPKGSVGSIAGAQVFIGRMEGLIKEALGQQGELTALMADMMGTGPGSIRALMLGTRASDLGTEAGQRRAIERLLQLSRPAFAAREAGAVEQANILLEQFSEAFTGGRLSPRTLIALNEQYGKLGTRQNEQLTMAQKWADELTMTGELFGTAGAAIRNLLIHGMTPLVYAFNRMFSVVVNVIKGASALADNFKPLPYIIGTVAVAAGVTAVAGLVKMVAATVALARAAGQAATNLTAAAIAQRAVNATSGGQQWLPGMGPPTAVTQGSWVTRAISFLKAPVAITTMVGLVSTILAAGASLLLGGAIGSMIHRWTIGRLWEEEERSKNLAMTVGQDLKARAEAITRSQMLDLVQRGANSSEMRSEIDRLLESNRRIYKSQGMTEEGADARARRLLRDLAPSLQWRADVQSAKAQLTMDSEERRRAAAVAEATLQQVQLLQEMLENQAQQLNLHKQSTRIEQETFKIVEREQDRKIVPADPKNSLSPWMYDLTPSLLDSVNSIRNRTR